MQEPATAQADHPQPETRDPAPAELAASAGYRVRLDAYAGPLDLLLYLVKRHEIDLHDIPVAELTEQYLKHLEVIKQIDFESAGEFLVMAATLVEIKSRMIIPAGEQAAEDAADPAAEIEETADPRFELVQQLLAYKAYKDAAYALDSRAAEWDDRFPARARAGERPPQPEQAEERQIDIEDVNVYDLCEAFGRLLETVGHVGDHEVTYDDTPISLHAEDIHDRLLRDAPVEGLTLREIFEGRQHRSEMIGLFLATLELVRQRLVTVVQNPDSDDRRAGASIRLVPIPEAQREQDRQDTDKATDWTDPATGKVQYAWPDEASKERHERRERLKAKLADRAGQQAEDARDTGGSGGRPESETVDDKELPCGD